MLPHPMSHFNTSAAMTYIYNEAAQLKCAPKPFYSTCICKVRATFLILSSFCTEKPSFPGSEKLDENQLCSV